MLTYVQATGALIGPDGKYLGFGYSGNGHGLNNPAFQNVHNVGPIPVGLYTMLEPIADDPVVGEYAIPLQPDSTNEMYGRGSFYLHGDNPAEDHTASEGCIVAGRPIRELAWTGSTDHRLQVIEDLPEAT